jgi:hypothetical protein
MVVHTYKPSYSGGRDWEDNDSRLAQANSWPDPISTNKLTMVAHISNSSYLEAIGQRIMV